MDDPLAATLFTVSDFYEVDVFIYFPDFLPFLRERLGLCTFDLLF